MTVTQYGGGVRGTKTNMGGVSGSVRVGVGRVWVCQKKFTGKKSYLLLVEDTIRLLEVRKRVRNLRCGEPFFFNFSEIKIKFLI